ncbi:MAG: hypothetical protein HQ478_14820 [Chloroflexi bacterium]|nr:hypothetical protein [Chloroflexota bacterium]
MIFKTIFAAMLIVVIVGCGTDDTPAVSSDEESSSLFESSLIIDRGVSYSVEDLRAVGWKSSQQLETGTLPGATEVWYGFFQQKDIEVRIYESHEAAREFGAPPAKATIDEYSGARDGAHGPWTPNIAQYGAFEIIGNLVLMCELELATCEALANELP